MADKLEIIILGKNEAKAAFEEASKGASNLGKELDQAGEKGETAAKKAGALGNVKWAAVGAGAAALTGVMSDLANAGAEDEAAFKAVEIAAGNAADAFDETQKSLEGNKYMLGEYQAEIEGVQAKWQTASQRLHEATVELESISGSSKEATARKKELSAEIAKLEKQTKAYAKEAGELYDESDKLTAAIKKQEGQIKSQSVAVDVAAEEMAAWIDHMRDTSAVADDQTKPALASLIAVTGDYQKAMELGALAADLARGKNMDYKTAAELVGKVAEGNVTMLKRYGITLDENATAEEALAELQKRFAGQSAEYAATTAGQMDILKLKVADFGENVGQAMGPAMGFIGLLPGLSSGFSMVGAVLGPLAPAFAGLAGTITSAVIPALGGVVAALSPILIPIALVAAAVVGLYLAYQSNFLGIRDIVDSVLGWMGPFITGAIEAISAVWSNVWETMRSNLQATWDAIRVVVEVAWTLLSGIVTVGLQVLQGDWAGAWNTIKGTLSSVWDQIKGIVRSGVNTVIGFINKLIGAWNGLAFKIPGFNVQIPSIDIPGVGKVGGGTLGWNGINIQTPNIATIPTLDTGGIVTQPTLAMLAANSRPEAIIPLDRMGQMGGPTFTGNITVQVNGAGNPQATGQAVVDALYSIASGRTARRTRQSLGY